MNNQFDIDREFAWDDEIQKDNEFRLIPEGEYDFTVKSFERGRFSGSDKLPPCNKAILKFGIALPDGEEAILTKELFLHSKCEGILCAFFTCIGQRTHGERLKMEWQRVPGSRGRLKIGIRKWKGRNGEDMESNEVRAFLEPKEPKAPSAPTFTAGAF